MNVRRFLAENSRDAMRNARLALGDEAVILSSRKVAEGFEVLAAALPELNEAAAKATNGPGAPVASPAMAASAPAAPVARAASAETAGEPGRAQPFLEYASTRPVDPSMVYRSPVAERPEAPAGATASRQAAKRSSSIKAAMEASFEQKRTPPMPSARPSAAQGLDAEREALLAEIKSMRTLMEGRFASLAWQDSMRRAPLRSKIAERLLTAGFSPRLARAVSAKLPDDFNADQAERWLEQAVQRNFRLAPTDEMIEQGGVYALVGPTGVGKTTTTAKLAARYVIRHGAAGLGLISADSYRVGAPDQLRIYGRILGVPVHVVEDASELQAALEALKGKHLVLVDTIGVGQRDARVGAQTELLQDAGVRRLLVLNTACQAETLEDVAQAYRGSGLAGCVFSKVDEAVKLGSAIDCAMRHQLPLHYVSNGQRVPEDLHLPAAPYLVHRALKPPVAGPFTLNGDEAALLLSPTQELSLDAVAH